MASLFENLTARQLDALPRKQTVFFYPVASLEDHGPHLPLGLDLFESEKLCHLAALALEEQQAGWSGVVMPRAPLGIQTNTTRVAFPVRAHVLRDWLVDSSSELARLGFKQFVCFAGNPSPRDLTAIEEAGKSLRRRAVPFSLLRLFKKWVDLPVLVSARSGLATPQEVRRAPFFPQPVEHGGARDTAVALGLVPEMVAPEYAALTAQVEDSSGIGRFWKRRRHEIHGYWGAPAEAQVDEDSLRLRAIVDEAMPKLRAVWSGSSPEALFRSWYSVLLPNKSFFKAWMMALAAGALMLFWVYFSLQALLN